MSCYEFYGSYGSYESLKASCGLNKTLVNLTFKGIPSLPDVLHCFNYSPFRAFGIMINLILWSISTQSIADPFSMVDGTNSKGLLFQLVSAGLGVLDCVFLNFIYTITLSLVGFHYQLIFRLRHRFLQNEFVVHGIDDDGNGIVTRYICCRSKAVLCQVKRNEELS